MPMTNCPSTISSSTPPSEVASGRRRDLLTTMNRQSVRGFDLSKPKNRILRWNLLYTAIIFSVALGLGCAPLWPDSFAGYEIRWYISAVLLLAMEAVFWIAAFLTWPRLLEEWSTYRQMDARHRHFQKSDVDAKGRHINRHLTETDLEEATVSAATGVQHLVIMVGYNETVELMCTTVDSVASQTSAKSIVMVVGLEERTPDYERKIAYMQNRYRNSFRQIIFAVHPYKIPGEVAGTCSNVNWALRQATTQLRDAGTPLNPKMTIVTKMDTDALFLPTHFEYLENEFLRLDENKRLQCTYQSPLIYNLSLDERFFFTRVIGVLRTFFMMGFLIPYNINTMSIYHVSLDLARNAGYWMPHYQMEDIIQNLNFMCGIGKQIPIQFLPVPVVSGPTSGEDLREEYTEWHNQARRWAYGAAEVFHYLFVKLIRGKFDLRSGFSYGFNFLMYYGFVLCGTGLYQTTLLLASLFLPSYHYQHQYFHLYVTLFAIKFALVFGTAYMADILHRHIGGIDEPALKGQQGWMRSIFHYLSTPFVLLAYNVVGAAALLEMAYRGRDICGHVAAKKTALKTAAGSQDLSSSQTSSDLSASSDSESQSEKVPIDFEA